MPPAAPPLPLIQRENLRVEVHGAAPWSPPAARHCAVRGCSPASDRSEASALRMREKFSPDAPAPESTQLKRRRLPVARAVGERGVGSGRSGETNRSENGRCEQPPRVGDWSPLRCERPPKPCDV